MRVKGTGAKLSGETQVPGDKSISHRAVMLGALAEGETTVTGFLAGEDCLATIACFRGMGVTIDQQGSTVRIQGVGLRGLQSPQEPLYVGNSGTTIRLLLGILAGQNFSTVISGDASIRKRPMARVAKPLRLMGACIAGEGDLAPLTISPVQALTGIHYELPVASAQVKSALLLAGLYAQGATSVAEPAPSRDHTEIMLQAFGVAVKRQGLVASVEGTAILKGRAIAVPGDISSAAFLLVAALIIPGSELIIRQVGVNPTRTGILEVLQAMGADIEVHQLNADSSEPVADIVVRSSELRGVTVEGAIIPRLIDEIPALAIAAAFAEGETIIHDAAELKVKESNRIAAMVEGLQAMGGDICELADGLLIRGGRKLRGAMIDSRGDHRIAMAFAIAGLTAAGETIIDNEDCIPVSFPGFAKILRQLGANVQMDRE
jgi:3-phosphoshikimate 1-carboxyvinyltransferase